MTRVMAPWPGGPPLMSCDASRLTLEDLSGIPEGVSRDPRILAQLSPPPRTSGEDIPFFRCRVSSFPLVVFPV